MVTVEQHAEHALEGLALMAGEPAGAGFTEQRSVVIEHAFYRTESGGSTDDTPPMRRVPVFGRVFDRGRGER